MIITNASNKRKRNESNEVSTNDGEEINPSSEIPTKQIQNKKSTKNILTVDKLRCGDNEEEKLMSIDFYSIILKYLVGSVSHWHYLQTCRRINKAYNLNVFASHMEVFQRLHIYTFVSKPEPEKFDLDLNSMEEYITFYRKMIKLVSTDTAFTDNILKSVDEKYITATYNLQSQSFSHFSIKTMTQREWTMPLPLIIVLENQHHSEFKLDVLHPQLISEIDLFEKNQMKTSTYFTYQRALFQYIFMYTQTGWGSNEYRFELLEYSGNSQGVDFDLHYLTTPSGYFQYSPPRSFLPNTYQDPWFINKIEFLHQSRENVTVFDWDSSRRYNRVQE